VDARLRPDQDAGDESLQAHLSRQDDHALAQKGLRLAVEVLGEVAILRQAEQVLLEEPTVLRVQPLEPEVAADLALVAQVGRLARRRDREQHRRQSELVADVVRDPDWHGVVVSAEEATVLAERAELQREAEPHVVTAAAVDLDHVGLGEGPAAGELLVVRVGRQERVPHGGAKGTP